MSRLAYSTRSCISVIGLVLLTLLWAGPWLLLAQTPYWWSQRGVLKPNTPANDFAILNLGQLKNLALAAAEEFDDKLASVGGAGAQIDYMLANWTHVDPATGRRVPKPTPQTNDFAAANLGQLKATVRPFYDRLIALRIPTEYPWAFSVNAANDYAPANLGQAKSVFSFRLDQDSDSDGRPDVNEIGIGSDPGDEDSDNDGVLDGDEPEGDLDGDGLENSLDEDRDGDGRNDALDKYPDDERRDSDVPPGVFDLVDLEANESSRLPVRAFSTGYRSGHLINSDDNNRTAFAGIEPADEYDSYNGSYQYSKLRVKIWSGG